MKLLLLPRLRQRSIPRFPALRVAALVCVSLLLCTAAGAPAAPPPEDHALRDVIARNLTRIVLMDLRAVAAPAQLDYEIASMLLGIAHEMAPQDQDILRKHIEAAYGAGDETLVLDLTRRLLDLDAHDSVAWLRLISASISRRHQTADDRLAAYEALLGEQGRGLDPSVRSRLALDAALLLYERGDQSAFIDKLTLAMQLDPTHKEAAALAANFVATSDQGPAATLESLSILLMADPVDPSVHLAISRLLITGGAFEAAQRFHRNALVILQAANALSDHVLLESRMLQWHVEGPGAVAARLSQELLVAQDAAVRAVRLAREAKRPIEGMQRPEDVRFPLHLAALATIAAQAAGEEATARATLVQMAADVEELQRGLRDAVIRGDIEDARARRSFAAALLQLQSVRLWAGHQIEEAAADHAANRPLLEEASPEALQLLEGWLALRQGQPKTAIETLEPLAEGNTLAMLGVATALEALEETQSAIAEYERLVRTAPLEAAGAWARTRMAALGHEERASRETIALERIAAGVPRWVDDLVVRPHRYVQLSTRAVDTTIDGLQHSRIRITIRNLAEIPLSLGADRAINSRMLLSPKLELGGRGLEHMIRPEVFDFDRRFRLMPRESIEAEVWPDPGLTGWLTEVLANHTIRVRWRIIQGFMLEQRGGFRPGPMSQVVETERVDRRPLPETSLPPDVLAQRIAGDPARGLPALAAAIRAQLLQPILAPTRDDIEFLPPEPGGEPRMRLRTERMELLRPAIQALADRYPSLSPTHRAALVVIMPHAVLTPLVATFDQVARADTDPLVMSIVLVTRVTGPQDEYLARAAQSGDERLQHLAPAIAERLKATDEFYARLSPEERGEVAPPVDEGGALR